MDVHFDNEIRQKRLATPILKREENAFMVENFFAQLDRIYRSEPQSAEGFLLENLAQCRQENDWEGVIGILNELGSLYRGQARYTDSLQYFQEALEGMGSLGLTDSKPYLTALMNRAGTLRLAGRAEEAVSDFQHVLTLLNGPSDETRYIRASTLNNLGLAYQSLGRLAEAEDCAEQALEIIQTLPYMEAEIASSGNNLAALCLRQNRLEEAEGWLEKAMGYYQSFAGQQDPHRSSALTTLAALRCRQDRLEEALDSYERAAAITERFAGRNRNYASILHSMALVCHALGRKDAASRLKEAVELYETLGDSGSPTVEKIRSLLAQWESEKP